MINIKEFRIGSYFHPIERVTVMEGDGLVVMKDRFYTVAAIHEAGAFMTKVHDTILEYRTGGMAAVELTDIIFANLSGFEFITSDVSARNKASHWRMQDLQLRIYKDKTTINFMPVLHCEYVHQLQNLFYCLTGKEINIF